MERKAISFVVDAETYNSIERAWRADLNVRNRSEYIVSAIQQKLAKQ